MNPTRKQLLTCLLTLVASLVVDSINARAPHYEGTLIEIFSHSVPDSVYKTEEGREIDARVELRGPVGQYVVNDPNGAFIGQLRNIQCLTKFVDQYDDTVPAIVGDWIVGRSRGYFVFRAPGGDEILDGYWGRYGSDHSRLPASGSWNARLRSYLEPPLQTALPPEPRATSEAKANAPVPLLSGEQVIGTNNILTATYLRNGVKRAESVGCIVFRRFFTKIDPQGRPREFQEGNIYGTCFLVGDGLVLTANHVVDTSEIIEYLGVQFDELKPEDGTVYEIEPTPIASSPAPSNLGAQGLDYALLRLKVPEDKPIVAKPFRMLRPKLTKGQVVAVIHHPEGNIYKHVTLHDSWITETSDRYLLYTSDTLQGSSGAPILNRGWEVIALHHGEISMSPQAAVPPGEPRINSAAPKVANIGFRIDAIEADIREKIRGRADEQQILNQLGLK